MLVGNQFQHPNTRTSLRGLELKDLTERIEAQS
jgi:hypothetical protein